MKNNMKGQAAMEYLMTYGWALLAIVIVIAALLYLNPFGAPELCLFQQQGFSCSEPNPQVYLDSGGDVTMNIRLWNKLGKAVEIDSITCTNVQVSEIDISEATSASTLGIEQIPTGASQDYVGFKCIDADGDPFQLSPNQEFRGKLIVWYNYVDDIDMSIKHQAQANVISLIVEQ